MIGKIITFIMGLVIGFVMATIAGEMILNKLMNLIIP